jgi:selenocysteine-specific elongation factor
MSNPLAASILKFVSGYPEGVMTAKICDRFRKSPQELGDILEELLEEKAICGFAGLWLLPEALEVGKTKFLEALMALHKEFPSKPGIPLADIVIRAGLSWSRKPLDRIAARLEMEGCVVVRESMARHAEFHPTLPARQRQFLDRVLTEIRLEEIDVPNPYELSKLLHAPKQAMEETIQLGILLGELIYIEEGIYYTPEQLELVRKRMIEAADGKPFSVAQMRDRLATSRKYVYPLMQYFGHTNYDSEDKELG